MEQRPVTLFTSSPGEPLMNIPTEPFRAELRKHELPPIDWLRARFSYDPETGVITGPRGPCTALSRKGYVVVALTRTLRVKAHRLAFALMEGRWPHLLDHEDRDKSNNRWANLREATNAENKQNMPGYHIWPIPDHRYAQGFTWRVKVTTNNRVHLKKRVHFCAAVRVRKDLLSQRRLHLD
jgi:hypothetical protein